MIVVGIRKCKLERLLGIRIIKDLKLYRGKVE